MDEIRYQIGQNTLVIPSVLRFRKSRHHPLMVKFQVISAEAANLEELLPTVQGTFLRRSQLFGLPS